MASGISCDEGAALVNSFSALALFPTSDASPPSSSPTTAQVTEKESKENDMLKMLQDLTKRVENQENAILYNSQLNKQRQSDPSIHEQVQRAYNSVVIQHSIYSSVFKWVPENYYTLALSQRKEILGAHSTWQLCKSMLLENKAYDQALSAEDGSYSRFYLIVLQYETTISTKKLVSEVRALKQPVTKRYDTNKFDFRLASSEDNDRLTGYTHNAVSPFGLLDTKAVTIILSKSITESAKFIWMGGGHVHCKIGMATSDFKHALSPLVLDVTEARNGNDELDE